ncbi:MAG: alpha-amylase, partial [Bacteroidota bacterium]
ETFGHHQGKETGIFDFLKAFPGVLLEKSEYRFKTPSQLGDELQPASPLHVQYPISWADEERDITAWLGNEMQNEAFNKLYDLKPMLDYCKDPQLLSDWEKLQTSDHFYYMSTKWFSEGVIKTRINPYHSPYDAFINYMNVLVDFEIRVKKQFEATGSAKAKPAKKSTVKKNVLAAKEKAETGSGKKGTVKTSTKRRVK